MNRKLVPFDHVHHAETAFGLLPAPCQRLFARNNATYASHVEATACFNQFPVPRYVDDVKRLAAFGLDYSASLPWYEAQAQLPSGSIAAFGLPFFRAVATYYRRMDQAIEEFSRDPMNIYRNFVLDLTQWNLDQDYFAFLQYFFGPTSPIEYSFRLTSPMERLLRDYTITDRDNLATVLSYEYLNTTRHLNPTTLAPDNRYSAGASEPVTMSGRFRHPLPRAPRLLQKNPDHPRSTSRHLHRYLDDAADIEALVASLDSTTQRTPQQIARNRGPGSLSIAVVAAYDAGAAADAEPIGVTDVYPTADLTLKFGGTDWPLLVWRVAVDQASPDLIATSVLPPRPKPTRLPTTFTATLRATTSPATGTATAKSAGMRATGSWMVGAVALAGLVGDGWPEMLRRRLYNFIQGFFPARFHIP
ncbi:hypothetical protein HDU96_006822 [Phlyctochytrium bullatum]|nr:hypothetical protein HDU96_006822 [Phlyctochytrium bullatum]